MGTIKKITESDLDASSESLTLVDVREPIEYAGGHKPGSINIPLSKLASESRALRKDRPVVLICRSGRRSADAASRLQKLGFSDVRVLEGGMESTGVWAMERQVRLVAGSLVLLGAVLARLLTPLFWLLSIGVGAGLVISALTNTCTMALILSYLPWNRSRSHGSN